MLAIVRKINLFFGSLAAPVHEDYSRIVNSL